MSAAVSALELGLGLQHLQGVLLFAPDVKGGGYNDGCLSTSDSTRSLPQHFFWLDGSALHAACFAAASACTCALSGTGFKADSRHDRCHTAPERVAMYVYICARRGLRPGAPMSRTLNYQVCLRVLVAKCQKTMCIGFNVFGSFDTLFVIDS